MKKVIIYRDENFESETRKGMKITYDAFKELLSTWDKLNIGPCDSLHRLATEPASVYKQHFEASLEVPEKVGNLMVNKTAYINLIEIPIPNSLYLAAKKVTKSPCFGYVDVWSLQDGAVIMNEEIAESVINSHNIVATNEAQLALGLAVPMYVKLSCFINSYFKVIPWQHVPGMPWTLTGKAYPNISDLVLEVEQLRVIMSNLEGDVPAEIVSFLPEGFDLDGLKKILLWQADQNLK